MTKILFPILYISLKFDCQHLTFLNPTIRHIFDNLFLSQEAEIISSIPTICFLYSILCLLSGNLSFIRQSVFYPTICLLSDNPSFIPQCVLYGTNPLTKVSLCNKIKSVNFVKCQIFRCIA